jgi:hypothetical protein
MSAKCQKRTWSNGDELPASKFARWCCAATAPDLSFEHSAIVGTLLLVFRRGHRLVAYQAARNVWFCGLLSSSNAANLPMIRSKLAWRTNSILVSTGALSSSEILS